MSGKSEALCLGVIFMLAFGTSSSSVAQITCNYTSFEAVKYGPGSGVWGINRYGEAVGTYGDKNFNTHGFYRSPEGKISLFSIRGAVDTFLIGINDKGTMVGYYQTVNNNTSATGFKLKNGTVTKITYPKAVYTEPHGINDNGVIVGWYALPSSPGAAFKLSNGHFKSLSYPGAFSTAAWGINNSGEIVGDWEDSNLNQSGFIYNNGQFQNVSYPGSTGTILTGVNDSGEIVGYYLGPGPDQLPFGFVYNNGTFQTVDIPNTADNVVFGINDGGDLGGVYQAQKFGNDTAFIGTNCH